MTCTKIWHYIYNITGKKQPFQRGFFCDDESLKYPVKTETISNGECFIIWASIGLALVVTVEILYHNVYATSFETNHRLFTSMPWVVVELYRVLGACFLGGLFTYTTTELAKFQVGR